MCMRGSSCQTNVSCVVSICPKYGKRERIPPLYIFSNGCKRERRHPLKNKRSFSFSAIDLQHEYPIVIIWIPSARHGRDQGVKDVKVVGLPK